MDHAKGIVPPEAWERPLLVGTPPRHLAPLSGPVCQYQGIAASGLALGGTSALVSKRRLHAPPARWWGILPYTVLSTPSTSQTSQFDQYFFPVVECTPKPCIIF